MLFRSPTSYIFPSFSLNLGLGGVGGVFLGLAVGFLVARLDDRVRSVIDIESFVGLPLIGVLPDSAKLEAVERAQVVANRKHPMTVEGFAGIYSSLCTREDFARLKVLVVTSSVPGEGKSFVSSVLSATFATRGERVCLVDSDLRKPVQHRLQGGENDVGVISYCEGRSTVDEIIQIGRAHV